MEKELLELGGFTRGQLYNRRGGLDDRGLASLLEHGDSIIKVEKDVVHIRTREGTVQTFHNMETTLPFLRPATDAEKDALRLRDEEELD